VNTRLLTEWKFKMPHFSRYGDKRGF